MVAYDVTLSDPPQTSAPAERHGIKEVNISLTIHYNITHLNMSSANFTNQSDPTFTAQPPPAHHIHRDSEILPGARGAETKSSDYGTAVTNDPQTWARQDQQRPSGVDSHGAIAGAQHGLGVGETDHSGHHGRSALSEDRPLGVQPASQGLTLFTLNLSLLICVNRRCRCRWSE